MSDPPPATALTAPHSSPATATTTSSPPDTAPG
jgi:hypothetical protein